MCSRFRDARPLLLLLVLSSCQEARDRPQAGMPPGLLVKGNRQSELQPGKVETARAVANPYGNSGEVLEDGKRLYNQMNCSGCHAAGGGAIGPPLMDDEWIYGSSPENVFWTIIEGRPQGMPAFGGRISEDQVWRIVAYVRSLSGLNKEN